MPAFGRIRLCHDKVVVVTVERQEWEGQVPSFHGLAVDGDDRVTVACDVCAW